MPLGKDEGNSLYLKNLITSLSPVKTCKHPHDANVQVWKLEARYHRWLPLLPLPLPKLLHSVLCVSRHYTCHLTSLQMRHREQYMLPIAQHQARHSVLSQISKTKLLLNKSNQNSSTRGDYYFIIMLTFMLECIRNHIYNYLI